jgi:hypothetical protein
VRALELLYLLIQSLNVIVALSDSLSRCHEPSLLQFGVLTESRGIGGHLLVTAQYLVNKEKELLQLSVHNRHCIFDLHFHLLPNLRVEELQIRVIATLCHIILVVKVLKLYLALHVQSKSLLGILDNIPNFIQIALMVFH